MSPFKKILTIAILVLPLIGLAKSASPSFSSGFSSHSSSSSSSKSATKSTTPSVAKSSGSSFGSFGSGKPSAAPSEAPKQNVVSPNKSNSALSNSLDKNAAQNNALKTLDARTAQTVKPLSPQNKSYGQVNNSAASNNNQSNAGQQNSNAGGYYGQAAPTAAYQNKGGPDLTSGLIGFMLGKSLNSGNSERQNQPQHAVASDEVNHPQESSPIDSNIVPDSAKNLEGVAEIGSLFGRLFMWLLLIAAVIFAIRLFRRRSIEKSKAFASRKNYSL